MDSCRDHHLREQVPERVRGAGDRRARVVGFFEKKPPVVLFVTPGCHLSMSCLIVAPGCHFDKNVGIGENLGWRPGRK
jgi:hypothetical protein